MWDAGQKFAVLVRELRRGQGLSQDALAARAGVARSTLSRWERGEHLPGGIELKTLLTVLGATPEQVAAARRAVNAPRAHEHPPGADDEPGSPVGGDLLRALRRRRGRTQEDVARAVGVPRATLARWETSDVWPAPAQLHALCWELRAHPAEVTALTAGRFSPLTSLWQGESITRRFRHVDEFEAYMYGLRVSCTPADQSRLSDLHYIVHFEGLWAFGGTANPLAAALLTGAYRFYAQTLMDQGRLAEAERYATYTLRLSDTHRLESLALRIPALLVLSERDVYGDGLPFAERRERTLSDTPGTTLNSQRRFEFGRGIRRLRSVAEENLPVDYATWVLAHLARYATGAGRHEEAARFAGRALDVVRADPEHRQWEIRSRQQLLARILLRGDRAAQTLYTLADVPLHELAASDSVLETPHAQTLMQSALTRVAAHLRLGQRHTAHDELHICRAALARPDCVGFAAEVEALCARF